MTTNFLTFVVKKTVLYISLLLWLVATMLGDPEERKLHKFQAPEPKFLHSTGPFTLPFRMLAIINCFEYFLL